MDMQTIKMVQAGWQQGILASFKMIAKEDFKIKIQNTKKSIVPVIIAM